METHYAEPDQQSGGATRAGPANLLGGSHTGDELGYEAGKRMSKTLADYINVGMEHGSFDMGGLDRFLRL